MKKKMERNILAWLLVISMIVPMLSSGIIAKAEEGTETTTETESQVTTESETKSVKAVWCNDISAYRSEENRNVPTDLEGTDGYVFAGWYEDEACEKSIGVDDVSGGAYAKFVPKEVLGVKAQIPADLIPPAQIDSSTEGAIRIVTSVDSLNYKEVGFKITANGKTFTSQNNDKVYEQLFYISEIGTEIVKEPESITPQEMFCATSKYFKTQTFYGIPSGQFDTQMEVVPFWETLDGTIVEVPQETKSVNAGKNVPTYVVKNNDELTRVLTYINENKLEDEKTIKVTDSFEIPSTVSIQAGRNIVLENYEEANPVTIYRGAGLNATAMFSVEKDAALTVRGVGANADLVLDGRTENEANANTAIEKAAGSSQSLIINNGNLTIDNSKVQYVKKTVNAGAVINNATGATLTIKDSVFEHNNTATHGSVLYSVAQVSITGSTFTNNKADSGHGGTIWNSGASLSIDKCKFEINKAALSAGAIYNSGINGSVKNSKFESNEAKAYGGAIYNTGTGLNIVNSTFNGNEATGNYFGGAIFSATGKDFSITGSAFTGNLAPQGGAVYIETKVVSTSIIKDTTFTGNTAANAGGGIRFSKVAPSASESAPNSQITVTDCSFVENKAENAGGGAIYSNAVVTLNGTDVGKAYFRDNKATKEGTGLGGAVYCGSTLQGSGYIFEGGNTPQAIAEKGTNKYTEYTASNMIELKSAIDKINDSSKVDNNVCIKVTSSFEVTERISVPRNKNNATVLYNEGGTPENPVTLYRGTGCSNGMFFTFGDGPLAIRGVGDTGSFVLDGRTEAVADAGTTTGFDESSGSLITNNGTLTLDHVKVQYAHKATGGGAAVGFGNYDNVTATIRDSAFVNNETALGGAIYITGAGKTGVKADITNTTFTNNKASSNGGAIYNLSAELSITSSTFTGNETEQGGAVYHKGTENVNEKCSIKDTKFISNKATNAGGALRNDKGTMIVTDCRFEGNTAANAGGGAIYNNLFLTLQGTDTTKAFFKNNRATGASGKGGAVYSGGTLRGSGYLFESNTPDEIYVPEGGVNLYR